MRQYEWRRLEPAETLDFRDQLRAARAAALSDAEGFQHILFTLERLGCVLTGKILDLGKYEQSIADHAKDSALAQIVPKASPGLHSHFATLYDLVRNGRNDALHQGAYARQLTTHAVELCLVLEDALMQEATTIGEFMVKNPVQAYLWHPLSFLRQTMLENSFSYLPVYRADKSRWCFVSDHALAAYLRADPSERKSRLAEPLGSATERDGRLLIDARTVAPNRSVLDTLQFLRHEPVLVVDDDDSSRLLGIATAFDVL